MKRHNTYLSYFFVLVLALMAATRPAKGAETNHLVLITSAARQTGEVFVNGFPLLQLSATNSVTISTFAEPFLVNGTNKLTFRFSDPTNNFTNLPPATASFQLEYGPEATLEGQATRTKL